MDTNGPFADAPCPCGTRRPRAECCGPYVDGRAHAPTAETLMRSRYTAFAEANVTYIRDTLHDTARKDFDEAGTRDWATKSTWSSLEVREVVGGGPDDAEGVVEFIARYRYKGEPVAHHERASFVKEGGRWYFSDSEVPDQKPVVREEPKTGRNDPCPCGSGRKFKKCCGA